MSISQESSSNNTGLQPKWRFYFVDSQGKFIDEKVQIIPPSNAGLHEMLFFVNARIQLGEETGIFASDIDLKKPDGLARLNFWNECISRSYKPEDLIIYEIDPSRQLSISFPKDTLVTRSPSGLIRIHLAYDIKARLTSSEIPGTPEIKSDGSSVVGPWSYDPERDETMVPIAGVNIINDEPIFKIVRPNRMFVEMLYVYRESIPENKDIDKILVKNPEIRPGLLMELFRLIADSISNANTWKNLLAAILGTAVEQNWSLDEAYFLASEFTRLSAVDYAESRVQKEFQIAVTRMNSKRYPQTGFKTLIFFLAKHRPDIINEFREKWQLEGAESKCYDPDDEYYLLDYVNSVKGILFSSEGEMIETCVSLLSRCIRKVGGQGGYYIIKRSPKVRLEKWFKHPDSFYKDIAIGYLDWIWKEGELEPKERVVDIFSMLNDPRLNCSETVFAPYHPDEDDPTRDQKHTINLYPRCKAKRVRGVNIGLIQPILDHIYFVWANGNLNHYRYIIRWLAGCIKYPRLRRPALVLIGPQGCGKSIITTFLRNLVFGPAISRIGAGLTSLAGRFNAFLAHCCFFILDEMTVARGESWRAVFDIMKSLITEPQIMVEWKGKEVEFVDNFNNFIFLSNHEDCLKIDREDRRYAVFKCSNKYIGNRGYFLWLASCLTQEAADHFFTFLLEHDVIPGECWNIPMTQVKQSVISYGEPSCLKFIRSLESWECPDLLYWMGPYITFHKKRPYIPHCKFIETYAEWCRRFGCKACSGDRFSMYLENFYQDVKTTQRVNGIRTRGFFIDNLLPRTSRIYPIYTTALVDYTWSMTPSPFENNPNNMLPNPNNMLPNPNNMLPNPNNMLPNPN